MKKKVGTLINGELINKIKLLSVKEDKTMNSILEEALELYLRSRGNSSTRQRALVTDETWGAHKVKDKDITMVMSDENWYEI